MMMRKVLAEGPVVVASGLLWLTAAAVVPAPGSGAVLLLLAVVGVVSAAGVGESLVIRGLWRARPVSRVQWRIVLASVEHIDPGTRLWVVPGAAVAVFPVGRRGIAVSEGLLTQVASGCLPHRVVTALLVGAQAQLSAGMTRRDPTIRWWCFPVRLVLAPARMLGRSGVVRLGWRVRGVVFGIAIVQMSAAGFAWIGVAVAVLLAMTYLVPVWRRAWVAEQVGLFDAAVVVAGRGPDLAGWLRQVAGRGARDRIVALENPRLPQRL